MLNSEEDTFNRLRRPSFAEMNDIMKIWMQDDGDRRSNRRVLQDNHWGVDEYYDLKASLES